MKLLCLHFVRGSISSVVALACPGTCMGLSPEPKVSSASFQTGVLYMMIVSRHLTADSLKTLCSHLILKYDSLQYVKSTDSY